MAFFPFRESMCESSIGVEHLILDARTTRERVCVHWLVTCLLLNMFSFNKNVLEPIC